MRDVNIKFSFTLRSAPLIMEGVDARNTQVVIEQVVDASKILCDPITDILITIIADTRKSYSYGD